MGHSVAHPAWIEIDVGQFQKNLAILKERIGRRLLCCIVKGNAYGHGLARIGLEAEKGHADYLGVAHLSEAVALREAGVKIPILVLGAIHENQIDDLIRYRLEFTLSSKYKAELVAKKCRELNERCPIHVEIDTGVRRTGMRPESAPALIDYLRHESCFQIRGIYSHFANSRFQNDPTTYDQIAQFRELQKKIGLPDAIWHLASSNAVAFYPDTFFDMVRIGLLCYGLVPDGMDPGELKPILSLKARISYFKVVAADQGISYGHTYRTKSQTRIVTIPVGYGDGYRSSLSNRMDVLIRGKRYPIAGHICMDQFMVDIGNDEAYVGDEAVLIGKQGKEEIAMSEMSKIAGTDRRELLCHFNERIPRIYVGG